MTLGEAVGGFAIALVVGLALGVLFGKLRWLERALQPVIVAIQVVPKIALVPLFIVWFGFGMGSKVVIAAVLAFLPIMSNTILGVKSIERGHQEVMATLRAGRVPPAAAAGAAERAALRADRAWRSASSSP